MGLLACCLLGSAARVDAGAAWGPGLGCPWPRAAAVRHAADGGGACVVWRVGWVGEWGGWVGHVRGEGGGCADAMMGSRRFCPTDDVPRPAGASRASFCLGFLGPLVCGCADGQPHATGAICEWVDGWMQKQGACQDGFVFPFGFWEGVVGTKASSTWAWATTQTHTNAQSKTRKLWDAVRTRVHAMGRLCVVLIKKKKDNETKGGWTSSLLLPLPQHFTRAPTHTHSLLL